MIGNDGRGVIEKLAEKTQEWGQADLRSGRKGLEIPTRAGPFGVMILAAAMVAGTVNEIASDAPTEPPPARHGDYWAQQRQAREAAAERARAEEEAAKAAMCARWAARGDRIPPSC